jgi:hypothetical protein
MYTLITDSEAYSTFRFGSICKGIFGSATLLSLDQTDDKFIDSAAFLAPRLTCACPDSNNCNRKIDPRLGRLA